MLKHSIVFSFFLLLYTCGAFSQTTPVTGLRDNTPAVHALTNVRIVTAPGKVIQKGTLVIRNGIIEVVGENISIPADARIWKLDGCTLYSGFIDLSSDYGMQKPIDQPGSFDFSAPQPAQEKQKGAAHWNSKMKADVDAAEEFQPDQKAAELLRSQGFTLVLSTPQKGIFRGASALVTLGDGPGSDLVVKRRVAQMVTFEDLSREYPNSLMGVISFIRQTWIDADWYRRAQESFSKDQTQVRPETNNALAALQDALQNRQPIVMDASSELNFLRQAEIGKEFNLKLWIRGSGEEYKRIDAIKATKLPVIVPLNFPEPPQVENPDEALNVTLTDLRHWDAAPENPGRLQKAGVPITLTTARLKDAGTFLVQLRKAVNRGLNPESAFAALTTIPAQWLGITQQAGTLDKGKAANIIITDSDLFSDKTKIRDVWIDGKRYEVKPEPTNDARGTWILKSTLKVDTFDTLKIKSDADRLSGLLKTHQHEIRLTSITFSAGRIAFSWSGDSIGYAGSIRMSGTVSTNEIAGIGELPNGISFVWNAIRAGLAKSEPDTSKPVKVEMAEFPDIFPPCEFGKSTLPEQSPSVLVKNATIWTQGKQGKIEHADLLITKGKITQVGMNIAEPKNAAVIDATGKHVTPGIIDSHSHTAGGDNEPGQAVTSETRIEDVIDCDDIAIYRQLAGGKTISNVLHGSANPIGGQNAILKWRWGSLPKEMIIADCPKGIKFALGENVKQSNYMPGGRPSNRYPQTRMGVEELIRDRFKAALDYEREMIEWEKDKSKIPPHRDLELDALLETVKVERAIICHGYRQDELLMMMRVAEEFGIRVQSFEHVLEGYKIADVMAKHGVGGSTFSDWWAYKMEAYDAIPGNGPLMHQQGVLVAYNSDDDQLASRLNWEAAKALKFGVPEQEALAFVTSNPAKLLHIDDKVGSLEPGKDADFVIWSGSPLSTYTKCEQTWIDGKKYFDLKEDQQMRAQIQKERAALIQKILKSKKESPPLPGIQPVRPDKPYHQNRSSEMEVNNEN